MFFAFFTIGFPCIFSLSWALIYLVKRGLEPLSFIFIDHLLFTSSLYVLGFVMYIWTEFGVQLGLLCFGVELGFEMG